MLEIIKKNILAGIGFALKTKDEVEEWARDLVRKEQMSEEEGRKFVDELLKRYDENRGKLEERVEKSVKEFLKKADIVTGDQLKELKKEIREIKAALNQKK